MAQGCYKANYLPASFKGVAFRAFETTSEHGRRGFVGEFPFAENSAYADMGRKTRKYTISGRLDGNNHLLQSELLIAACESIGPGTLLHPTRGLVQAACVSLRVKDNPVEEQGVTYVDMEFVDAPDTAVGMVLGGALFAITMTAITAAAFSTFRENYTPNNVRYFRTKDVLKTSSDAIGTLQDEFNLATNEIRETRIYEALADFEKLRNDPGVLRNTDKMVQSIDLGISAVDKYTTGLEKFNAFKRVANWAARGSELQGEAYVVEESVYSTIRILAAGYMARGLTEQDPTTIEEALKQMDAVLDILSEELALSKEQCNNCLTVALSDFRVQVESILLKRVYNLPPVFQFDYSAGVHSLVAAYEIHGDAKRSRDINLRNGLQSPMNMGPTILGTVR